MGSPELFREFCRTPRDIVQHDDLPLSFRELLHGADLATDQVPGCMTNLVTT